jgi:MoaA/NifB/PqqE/SkfB family radical SAM enzyme
MQKSRERLRLVKPRVYDKLIRYLEAEKNGEELTPSLIDWTYGFECNFNCPHCSANAFQGPENRKKLSLEQIQDVADQADEIGIFVINLIGGEPLVWKELDEVVSAIGPDRFHISITTNGWFLTPDVTRHLASIGVDKLGISIDSGFEDVHDMFREKKGSYKRAIEGIKNAADAGIRTLVSTVATHQNIHSDGFQKLLEISQDLDVGLDIQCATVSGGWRGRMDVLIDDKDAEYLESLREKYPLTRRDVWSTPGSQGGCPAITRSVYIISSGEVLPCLFIHISLGNVLKEPLKDIIERGLTIREFKDFSKLCLAGEDKDFIEKYLSRTFSATSLPISFEEGFGNVSRFLEEYHNE